MIGVSNRTGCNAACLWMIEDEMVKGLIWVTSVCVIECVHFKIYLIIYYIDFEFLVLVKLQ